MTKGYVPNLADIVLKPTRKLINECPLTTNNNSIRRNKLNSGIVVISGQIMHNKCSRCNRYNKCSRCSLNNIISCKIVTLLKTIFLDKLRHLDNMFTLI